MNRIKRLLTLAICMIFLVSGLGGLTPGFGSVSAQTSDPVFVGAGDIAVCSRTQDEATANLLDTIPGTVFTLGDNAYSDGTLTQFNDCYGPSWGRHKSRTRPVPGNHDYHVSGAAGYFDYFGSAAGDRSKGYYSYDLGEWHIIALNSEIAQGAGSAQEQWLRADLAANPNVCTLAYWHKPRFSSGQHGNNTASQALWQALYEHKADVVLNGHDHTYERFAPQNPSGQADPNGIREFVVGTGGVALYSFPTIQPNSEMRNNIANGVLKLTLHATSYDWQFVPIAGQTFTDSGAANCVGDAAVPTATRTPPSGPTPTRTPTPISTTTLHIGDLDASSARQGNRWNATVTVMVHDASHNPVANATVSGTWSNGATGTSSCTTGSNGQCTLTKTGIRNGKSRVTFTVSSVTRTNFIYASSGNHDPDGSSTGTRIVIRKP
ncbi:MAG TPA: Ig-like domain-containing protein [Anaerolineales bacterium]|nr:Ig-like domain-containing protein [Anaerolineales bacterium]